MDTLSQLVRRDKGLYWVTYPSVLVPWVCVQAKGVAKLVSLQE